MEVTLWVGRQISKIYNLLGAKSSAWRTRT